MLCQRILGGIFIMLLASIGRRTQDGTLRPAQEVPAAAPVSYTHLYETLSEDEPTVYEFKTWMQDISDVIKEKGQRKLVLVFDNMDRLPAEKVKELWSSIHTFFPRRFLS